MTSVGFKGMYYGEIPLYSRVGCHRNVFSKTFMFDSVYMCVYIYPVCVYMSANRIRCCTCIHYIARHAQILTIHLGVYMSKHSRMYSNPSYEQTLPSRNNTF